MKSILIFFIISFAMSAAAQSDISSGRNQPGGPDPDRSIAAGTLFALQNEGIIHAGQGAAAKPWMRRLASQKLGDRKSRRVYLVVFSLPGGEDVAAIAVEDKSSIPEQSGLVVYAVSKILQPDGKPVPPRR